MAMRSNIVWGLVGVLGAGALSCSAGGASKTSKDTPGSGGASSTTAGGKGPGIGGLSGPGLGDVGGMSGTDVVGPDPANPHITHPKCNPGSCTDCPAEPLRGLGESAHADELFGQP